MDNTQREYGKISDLSGVQNVENDNDSVNKKQDYESKYNEEEAKKVKQQQAEEKRKLQEMQERVRQNRSQSNNDDFVDPISSSEIAKATPPSPTQLGGNEPQPGRWRQLSGRQ